MPTLALVLLALFGSPESALVARARAGIESMASCSIGIPADEHRYGRHNDRDAAEHRPEQDRVEHPHILPVSAAPSEGTLPASCPAHHALAAWVIGVVAAADPDPDEALALLLGLGAHETRFATMVQLSGGPARSWWQLEGPAVDRARWLADPVLAATVALARARTCGGSMRGYATGRCDGPDGAAAELRASVTAARWATR